jgi:hypothetical protein
LASLLKAVHRLVPLFGHDLETRHQFRELRLELMNHDVVVLHGQQRSNIWVHGSSDTL